jgi:hypothetical protein
MIISIAVLCWFQCLFLFALRKLYQELQSRSAAVIAA